METNKRQGKWNFVQALANAQRQPFTLEWNCVKKEIGDERAGILPPPIIPRIAALQAAEKPGKKQRRTSAKGKASGVLPPLCRSWPAVSVSSSHN